MINCCKFIRLGGLIDLSARWARLSGRCVAFLALLSACVLPSSALAGDVSILGATFRGAGEGRWNVSVTLRHADSGWEHYADAWRVSGNDGVVYGTRTLLHPHETEQPFTRSLSAVVIPKTVTVVFVEAHDKVHGWAKLRLPVDLATARDGIVKAEP